MSKMDSYFKKVKDSKPFISSTEVVDNFILDLVELEGKNTYNTRRSPSFFPRLYSQRFWYLTGVTSLIVLILTIGLNFTSNKFDNESLAITSPPKSKDFKIEPINQKREALIKYLDQGKNDSTQNVQVFFNKKNEQTVTNKIIPTLKVSREALLKMGFSFRKDETVFEANVKDKGYLMIGLGKDTRYLTIDDAPSPDVDFEAISHPLFVSDMKGIQRTRFAFGRDPMKLKPAYFNKLINDLVPIAIPHPTKEDDYLGIFWFKSTEELFDQLVEVPTVEQSEDAEILPTEDARKPIIKPLRNPFSTSLDVEYFVPETGLTAIHLMSIEGNLIRELIPKSEKEAGSYSASFQISDLKRGVYLLQMTTISGRATKRIIKE